MTKVFAAESEAVHETAVTTTEHESGGIAAGAQALGLNGVALAGQIVNFLILLFLLQRFLYRPLVGLLEKRRQEIETSVKQAAEMEERYADFQLEHEKRLTDAKAESAAIIERAKTAAEELRQETLAVTQKETETLLRRTQEEIARQKEQMMTELKGEIGSMVVLATSKVIGKQLDEKTQQELIKQALAEVKE